jgi:selenocysteine lyase/cysteine desulfurase
MAAHRNIDMESECIDYLAFSGHKTYAPFGSGALIVRKGLLNLSEDRIALYRSSGEENTSGIAALGKALSILKCIGFDLIEEKESLLTKRCISGLSSMEGVKPYGVSDTGDPLFDHKGPVVAFEVKDKWPQKISKVLAHQGFGLRYGCHCAHMLVKKLVGVPPFLEKFQGLILNLFPKLSLPGIIRISFGIGTKESDIDLFIKEIETIASNPAK